MDRPGWNIRYQEEELVFTADPSRFLGPEVAALAPGRALDLGSGEGRNAPWLAEQGWRVTAVDFSDVGMAKARVWPSAGVSRSTGWSPTCDLTTFPPPPSTWCSSSSCTLPATERRALLRRAATSLRPGGASSWSATTSAISTRAPAEGPCS